MDFKMFIDALLTGTPIAVLAALVGIIWQAVYVRSRDKLHDEQIRRELDIENRKFKHQKELEILRFEYEQIRWREELAREITIKIVDVRIQENSEIWTLVKNIASHRLQDKSLTLDDTKTLAQKIEEWRYGRGGLLAEEITRDVAFAFQTALEEYDGAAEKYQCIKQVRRVFREALRADIGMGESLTGQTIYETAEKRQKIREELQKIQVKLGISSQIKVD